jgi:hypothetical protein
MKELSINQDAIKVKVEKQVKVRDILVDVPIKYQCSAAINAVFPISTKAAEAAIGSQKVRPLEILPGKSLLCITIFDFANTPVGPFTELTFSIAASYNPLFRVPLLSIPTSMLLGKFGFFVVSIAQSTDIAIEHGNLITGYPHYKKTIAVELKRLNSSIHVIAQCDKQEILQLYIEKPAKEKIKRESHMTYLIKDNRIFRIELDIYGIIGKSKVYSLKLGDHELASYLKKFQISNRSIYTRFYRDTIKVVKSPKEAT